VGSVPACWISAPSSISKTFKSRLGFEASTWQASRDAAELVTAAKAELKQTR